MILLNRTIGIRMLLLGTAVLLTSCANTKISQSWVEPDNKKSYNDILIIGIAESEQNRRAYESYFVEALREKGTEAEASYKLIKSDQKIDRKTVAKAIEGMEIDGVPVADIGKLHPHLVAGESLDHRREIHGSPGRKTRPRPPRRSPAPCATASGSKRA